MQDYLLENKDKVASGEISDEMLHPTSFNPESDTRLHKFYSDRIKKAFNKNYQSLGEQKQSDTQEQVDHFRKDSHIEHLDPANMSHSQKLEADKLMARIHDN